MERMTAVRMPDEFRRSVDAAASVAGISRSELIRRSLARTLLRLAGGKR